MQTSEFGSEIGHRVLLPHANSSAITFAQYQARKPPKRLGKRQWVGKREKRGPEHGLDFRGDGHEREVDPWRYRALACDLARA